MSTVLETVATIGTPETTGTAAMVKQTADELERMLGQDAWLSSGQIATLLGRGRTTIWRRLQADDMRSRKTPGGQSEWHPDDVRRLLAEARKVHGE